MYIQSRRDPSVKLTTPYPRINSIKEITRFITTVDGEPKFTAWSNDEIRLKSLPSESDLRTGKIDLNNGFDAYWNQHLKDVHHPIAHKNHPLRSSASQKSSESSSTQQWPFTSHEQFKFISSRSQCSSSWDGER